MFIYQIGNVVMRGFATHSTPIKWKNEPTQNMINSSIKFNSPYSLPETSSYSISGDIVCYKGIAPTKLLNTISKLGGRPYIDIIGYLPNDCCPAGMPCSTCCGDVNNIRWFHTYGVINSVSREYQFVDTEDPLLSIPVTIDLTANPFWSPLNKYLWFPYYGESELTIFQLDETNYSSFTAGNIETTINTQQLFAHPKSVVPFHYEPEFVFYKRRFDDEYELYDPQYWGALNVSGVIKSSGLSTSIGNTDYYVSTELSHIDSMYCFSGFDSSVPATIGTLSISVDAEITPFQLDTSIATLDLNDMVTDFANYTFEDVGVNTPSIDTDLRIYIGNNPLAPSFCTYLGTPVRHIDNGILYIPPWRYMHRYPAELNGTNNHIVITKPDSSIQVAYIHKFLIN